MASSTGTRHPTALVHPSAILAHGVDIGPYCIVGPGVRVGEGCVLLAHVVLAGDASIGARNVFHPFSVIGGEPQARPLVTPTRPGKLEVGADNIFREHVTVSVSCEDVPTRIGSQNLFMAGVHVAHDVTVGSHCVIANGVQLAGHVVLEDWVTFGGLSGVAQHCRVGESAFVAAGAMCERNVPPFVIVQGDRARVRALNTVGLERRGVPRASLANLREAFALTFGHRDDGVSFDEAVRRLDLRDPYVDTFARALSTRG